MKNHWTNYLPELKKVNEVDRDRLRAFITNNGIGQVSLKEKINELRKQITELENEHEQKEIRIRKEALIEWSDNEIDEAKAHAHFMNLSDEEKSNLQPETKETLSNLNPIFKEIFDSLKQIANTHVVK